MKKAVAIIITLVLVCTLSLALVACNKTTPNSAVAVFEFNENDGINSFSMRRGILMQYKVDRLKSIDGVDASWSTDKDGKIRLVATNVGNNLSDVISAMSAEPELEFRTTNTHIYDVIYKGRTAVTDVSIGLDSITNPSVDMTFSKAGIDILNNNLGREIYIYMNGQYCINARTNNLISGDSFTLSCKSVNTLNQLQTEELVNRLLVAVSGIKVTSLNIEFIR